MTPPARHPWMAVCSFLATPAVLWLVLMWLFLPKFGFHLDLSVKAKQQ